MATPAQLDFFDFIFQFPDQGSWMRDPVIQAFTPSFARSQPGVQLLIYNPVETLQPPVPSLPTNIMPTNNALVSYPQLANSSVALPGFWGMLTLRGTTPVPLFLEDDVTPLELEDGEPLDLEGLTIFTPPGSLLKESGGFHILLEQGGRLLLEAPTQGFIPELYNHPNIQIGRAHV